MEKFAARNMDQDPDGLAFLIEEAPASTSDYNLRINQVFWCTWSVSPDHRPDSAGPYCEGQHKGARVHHGLHRADNAFQFNPLAVGLPQSQLLIARPLWRWQWRMA